MEERKIKRIDYTRNFLKSLEKLPERIIKQAEIKEKIFKENAFDPRLRTHKLRQRERNLGFLDRLSLQDKIYFSYR